jgi:hypothetical protein
MDYWLHLVPYVLFVGGAVLWVLDTLQKRAQARRRRLTTVAARFGTDNNTDCREIASGYRGDCAFTAVSRLSLLLDRDPKLVSFQTLYTKLQSETVVTLLLKRLDDNEFSISRTAELAKDSVQRFLQTYRSIDWQDLHGRLVHFRNRGVAHLTPQKIEKRVTYAELKTLSLAVAIMGECMEPFAKDDVPVRKDEIKEWSDRAFAVWKTVLA